ncbi:DNA primase small subunit [Cyclospora cayetanensis]|uniref:DNA primase n=1 Tax=Cyclospora cayetanensis TaxID=88456 RepID=A0A6P6RVI1_9EIME|nr:DNA primase small subunit [Cyclospora cayetanensis]
MSLLLPDKVLDDSEVTAAGLRFYYENLYPFEELQRWLSYRNSPSGASTTLNDPQFLAKREFCLTCKRNDAKDEEFFMRWQSFSSLCALKDRLLSMNELSCHKFDIGAVYTLPISQKDTHGPLFKAQQKELVFDIDMNDYDDVRTCCRDKRVCSKCWRFIAVAVRLLDAALREDFGFKHILWVFSGRRGIHAWICDTDARLMPNENRGQLAEYLNLLTGSDQQAKKISLWGKTQHPSVERAFRIAYAEFQRLLLEQDFFFSGGNTAQAEKLLDYLPDDTSSSASGLSTRGFNAQARARGEAAASDLKQRITALIQEIKAEGGAPNGKASKSSKLFERICKLANCQTPSAYAAATAENAAAALKEMEGIPNFIKEIVLAFSYPRLDINVR